MFFLKSQIVFYGDVDKLLEKKENVILMSNHQCTGLLSLSIISAQVCYLYQSSVHRFVISINEQCTGLLSLSIISAQVCYL